ncbi:hypothetical protein PSHT_08216 [Puccinia striiformis]|uniref:Uncharacterized protein n=1 Tax=Puccinia striiformis TaxID=27350 RepID=A0A2S4VRB4_9BASI|nr:hypothetical protein PSHT_08216 [Puccinia striiformis]
MAIQSHRLDTHLTSSISAQDSSNNSTATPSNLLTYPGSIRL